MSDLSTYWPPFGLRIQSPRLTLSPLRDEDMVELIDATLAGIHDPEVMPFHKAWTDAPRAELIKNSLIHHWTNRARMSPQDWLLALAVRADGRFLGLQELSGRDFAITRTVESGSWLTQAEQGKGYGGEMRAAILLFAFDHLGADRAESAADTENAPSLAVSHRLGYRENGSDFKQVRTGELREHQRLRLTAGDFQRPDWNVTVEGLGSLLPWLGVD